LPPSSLRSLLLKNLTPASGRQDHTTSPSASRPRSSARRSRPPHPALYVRDDRETPLERRRDEVSSGFDLGEAATEIFLQAGLDCWNQIDPLQKIRFFKTPVRSPKSITADDGGGTFQSVSCLWPHCLQANLTRVAPLSADIRFGAPHFPHTVSMRVLPCFTTMVLRSMVSRIRRSASSRIDCFDIRFYLS
jgi:hypothetical protein